MEAAADGVPDPVTSHLDGCKGKTPLHFATTSEQVQFLLDSGADPNSPDIYGGTPLHSQMFMAMSGLGDGIGIIRKLLEAGADPWLTTHGGKLPLEYAQMGNIGGGFFTKAMDAKLKAAGTDRSEAEKTKPGFKEMMEQMDNRGQVASEVIFELMKEMSKTAPPGMEAPESLKEILR